MGKALVIKNADFSVNGVLVNIEEVTPNWISQGFVYSNDNKIYTDNTYRVYGFHLVAGQTISYSMTQGSSTSTNKYGKVQVGIVNGHISQPSPTSTGASMGTVTPIKTIGGNVRYPAIPETSYTASADVTFFIAKNKSGGDVITVYTEI